ncbi:MAG: sulfatase [Myxococcota bacterium]|nr:sulfatase [Myxococcota bacterium]
MRSSGVPRLSCILALLGLSACTGQTVAAAGPPDILVLLLDTVRADRMGAWGWGRDSSAPLDRRIEQGVRFARAWAPSSWTRPSVGALLTGRQPPTLGITDELSHGLPDALPTLAEALRAQGYATCGVTANPNLNARFGFARGFDRYTDSTVVFPWMDDHGLHPDTSTEKLPSGPAVYAEALRCATDHAKDPLLLFVDVMEVHEHSRGAGSDLTRSDLRGRYGAPFGEYDDAMRTAAEQADGFLTALSETPGWDDGLIILLSDHGEGLDSHPSIPGSGGHGSLLYRSNLHVPLAMWGRSVDARRTVLTDVGLIDVPPTVFALAGVPAPGPLDGQSLVPELGGARPDRRVYGAWTRFRGVDRDAVMFDDWLYLTDSVGGMVELQPRMGVQDGDRTDQRARRGAAVARGQAAWAAMQTAHPWRSGRVESTAIDPAARAQLERLGYVDPP